MPPVEQIRAGSPEAVAYRRTLARANITRVKFPPEEVSRAMSQTLEQLGIDRLSVPDRLELIGQIWDSIDASEGVVPIPNWHSRELERRRAAAEVDPNASIPWEVVKARLADRS